MGGFACFRLFPPYLLPQQDTPSYAYSGQPERSLSRLLLITTTRLATSAALIP